MKLTLIFRMALLARGGLRAAGLRPGSAFRRSTRQLQATARRAAPVAMIGGTLLATGTRAFRSLRRPRWGFKPASSAAIAEPTILKAPEHPSFSLVRSETIAEYGATCHLYEHKKSKAQVLSVVADDDNKVFGVTFRTPPRDSTGLPHILEHSVLCGSRQYPTKEPFVELLKGSLQTFLNAFTYPDRTCYPVASQNLEDFRNLARVYLDAVFHPRAAEDPTVLQQEGWHYETNGDKLEYSGVVYNEMKGVYSSPDSLMARQAQQSLFPDNAYSVDSGGDPAAIPDLDFDQFKAFHGEFYHPGNSRIFFYGDDDPAARLELLDEYLADFSARDIVTEVAQQPLSIATPKRVALPFPASASDDDEAGQHMVSVNWLMSAEPLEGKDELGVAVLDHLLLGTSTATLRKALTDSGLGESVIGGGLQDELRQPTFAVGLKGVAKDDVEKVEQLVVDELTRLSEKGFEADDIASSLNTIEFDLREFNTGSFPKGLSFMLGMMRNWIYERDPMEALRFERPLAELKDELDKDANGYFTGLLKKLLVKNMHRVTIEMKPDATLEAGQKADEEARLAAARDEMTPEQLAAVEATAALLKEKQQTPDPAEALATIPTLGLDDLEREVRTIPRDEAPVPGHAGATLLTRELPTAGIVYADVALDMRGALDVDDLPLVPLFGRMLQETGVAGKYDATQFQRRAGARTGGISGNIMNTLKRPADGSVATGDDLVYRFIVRGKATRERAGDLFELMADMLTGADFAAHQSRCVEMLKESKARYESAFRTAGQSFATLRISSGLNLAGAVSEATAGVTHYRSVLALLDRARDDWPGLLAQLEAMRAKILKNAGSSAVINLTGDAATLEAARAALPDLADRVLGGGGAAAAVPDWSALRSTKSDEAFSVPTQVNYVAAGGSLYAPGETPTGADAVVRRFLSLDYLWNKVRVQGGAYGGSCQFNPVSGTFVFSSYRDPNLGQTLDTYGKAAAWMKDLEVDPAELTKAIVAAVGDLDSPQTPDQKGSKSLRHYLDGTTDAARQQFRDEVLAASAADFGRFAARLAALETTAAVFASASGIEEANAAGANLEVTKLL